MTVRSVALDILGVPATQHSGPDVSSASSVESRRCEASADGTREALPPSMNIEALRTGLSAIALEALQAARDLGHATSPLALYSWAVSKSTDDRQPVERQLAARQLADRVAVAALSIAEWR